jgi:hypothetical protein
MNDSFRLALEKHQQGFLDQAAQLYLGLLEALFPRASFIHCPAIYGTLPSRAG